MCPSNSYSSGIAGRYSNSHGVDLGLTGMRLFCKSKYSNTIHISEDKNGKNLDKVISGKHYALISAIRIKYNNGDKLSGFYAIF